METLSGPVGCLKGRFGWETAKKHPSKNPTGPGECPKLTLTDSTNMSLSQQQLYPAILMSHCLFHTSG